ncbi:MAG: hypothetical protein ACD_15C00048G0002 [uncultured bacterium]|nr:MAG: hypothetical protein ACD_15C00048G0002 [uncultured bacterium]
MKKTESLLLGIIAALGSLAAIATVAVTIQIFTSGEKWVFTEAYLYAPSFVVIAILIEELSKYIFISKKIAPRKNRRAVADAIFFGLGFALVESSLIFFSNPIAENIARGILETSMIHISTSAIIAGTITADYLRSNAGKILSAMVPAIIIHLAYNFSILHGMDIQASALSALSSLSAIAILITSSKRNQVF